LGQIHRPGTLQLRAHSEFVAALRSALGTARPHGKGGADVGGLVLPPTHRATDARDCARAGPNEFLHIDCAKRLTAAVAQVIARHAVR
jgi:hypothetical protein